MHNMHYKRGTIVLLSIYSTCMCLVHVHMNASLLVLIVLAADMSVPRNQKKKTVAARQKTAVESKGTKVPRDKDGTCLKSVYFAPSPPPPPLSLSPLSLVCGTCPHNILMFSGKSLKSGFKEPHYI